MTDQWTPVFEPSWAFSIPLPTDINQSCRNTKLKAMRLPGNTGKGKEALWNLGDNITMGTVDYNELKGKQQWSFPHSVTAKPASFYIAAGQAPSPKRKGVIIHTQSMVTKNRTRNKKHFPQASSQQLAECLWASFRMATTRPQSTRLSCQVPTGPSLLKYGSKERWWLNQQ